MKRDTDRKSMWDTREQYTQQLHEYNSMANQLRIRIDQNLNLVDTIQAYYSILKVLLSEIEPFMKNGKKLKQKTKDGREYTKYSVLWFKERIRELDTFIQAFYRANSNKLLRERNQVILPRKLKDDLYDLHQSLNKVRFDNNLTVPHETRDMSFSDLL